MNRISWLLNRLRVMSVSEVMFRIRRSVAQRWERRRVAAGWRPLPDQPVMPKCSLFGDTKNIPDEWMERFQLDDARLNDYVAGRINFFGHQPLDIGNPVAWHRDPVTGIEAPCTYGKDLNYRDDHIVGNVKFIWELGRHQHLVPLAVAYAVSGDLRYRRAVVDQIDSWIEQNPFAMGIHWCTSLEASLRLISWAVIHSLLVPRDGPSGLFASIKNPGRLGESIYQHAYFVRHFLSRYSSANNHLIGELSGLWVACQVFELGENGRMWAEFAHQELETQSGLQVFADGVNKEQAFYYHLWVLEYFFFVWMVSSRCKQKFSDEFVQRMLAMTRFLKDVSPNGGEPPQVGDADDGFVTRFEPTWPEDPYRELLEAVGSVFGETGTVVGEKAFWCRAMVDTDTEREPRLTLDWSRSYPVLYPHGGYAVLGNGSSHLVSDAGSLGYLGIAAHGHADALSFCLAVDAEWWLVDPGTYAYHSAPEWRSYFRGTAAHNTIRMNQQDQSQIAGPFMWSKKANAWIDDCSNLNNIQEVKSHHDGYAHLGIIHHRALKFSAENGQLEVLDTFEGSGERAEAAEIYYHFAPGVDIKPGLVDNSWVATWKGRKKRLVLYTDSSWRYEVFRGSTDPVSGWYSPVLEEKIPANTLRGGATWSPSLQSATRIVIEKI